MAEGPFGDTVIGGEVLDGLLGAKVDEEPVDLDEFAGRPGLAAFGEAPGVASGLGNPETAPARPAAENRDRRDGAVRPASLECAQRWTSRR
jgi:hypothetical protein